MDTINKLTYMIEVPEHIESDGILYVVEGESEIPFNIKRIFWIKKVQSEASRGDHATRKTNLVLIVVAGSCDVEVDDGKSKMTFHLDDSSKGLFISNMLWRTMRNFSDDCILIALCDREFEIGEETIDDYDLFVKLRSTSCGSIGK